MFCQCCDSGGFSLPDGRHSGAASLCNNCKHAFISHKRTEPTIPYGPSVSSGLSAGGPLSSDTYYSDGHHQHQQQQQQPPLGHQAPPYAHQPVMQPTSAAMMSPPSSQQQQQHHHHQQQQQAQLGAYGPEPGLYGGDGASYSYDGRQSSGGPAAAARSPRESAEDMYRNPFDNTTSHVRREKAKALVQHHLMSPEDRYRILDIDQLIEANAERHGQRCYSVMSDGIDVLERYAFNLLKPDKPDGWRSIRCSNSIYKTRIRPMVGADDLLGILGYTGMTQTEIVFPAHLQPDQDMVVEVAADLALARAEVDLRDNNQWIGDSQALSMPPAGTDRPMESLQFAQQAYGDNAQQPMTPGPAAAQRATSDPGQPLPSGQPNSGRHSQQQQPAAGGFQDVTNQFNILPQPSQAPVEQQRQNFLGSRPSDNSNNHPGGPAQQQQQRRLSVADSTQYNIPPIQQPLYDPPPPGSASGERHFAGQIQDFAASDVGARPPSGQQQRQQQPHQMSGSQSGAHLPSSALPAAQPFRHPPPTDLGIEIPGEQPTLAQRAKLPKIDTRSAQPSANGTVSIITPDVTGVVGSGSVFPTTRAPLKVPANVQEDARTQISQTPPSGSSSDVTPSSSTPRNSSSNLFLQRYGSDGMTPDTSASPVFPHATSEPRHSGPQVPYSQEIPAHSGRQQHSGQQQQQQRPVSGHVVQHPAGDYRQGMPAYGRQYGQRPHSGQHSGPHSGQQAYGATGQPRHSGQQQYVDARPQYPDQAVPHSRHSGQQPTPRDHAGYQFPALHDGASAMSGVAVDQAQDYGYGRHGDGAPPPRRAWPEDVAKPAVHVTSTDALSSESRGNMPSQSQYQHAGGFGGRQGNFSAPAFGGAPLATDPGLGLGQPVQGDSTGHASPGSAMTQSLFLPAGTTLGVDLQSMGPRSISQPSASATRPEDREENACGLCLDPDISAWCEKCGKYYCSVCDDRYHRRRSDHVRFPFSSGGDGANGGAAARTSGAQVRPVSAGAMGPGGGSAYTQLPVLPEQQFGFDTGASSGSNTSSAASSRESSYGGGQGPHSHAGAAAAAAAAATATAAAAGAAEALSQTSDRAIASQADALAKLKAQREYEEYTRHKAELEDAKGAAARPKHPPRPSSSGHKIAEQDTDSEDEPFVSAPSSPQGTEIHSKPVSSVDHAVAAGSSRSPSRQPQSPEQSGQSARPVPRPRVGSRGHQVVPKPLPRERGGSRGSRSSQGGGDGVALESSLSPAGVGGVAQATALASPGAGNTASNTRAASSRPVQPSPNSGAAAARSGAAATSSPTKPTVPEVTPETLPQPEPLSFNHLELQVEKEEGHEFIQWIRETEIAGRFGIDDVAAAHKVLAGAGTRQTSKQDQPTLNPVEWLHGTGFVQQVRLVCRLATQMNPAVRVDPDEASKVLLKSSINAEKAAATVVEERRKEAQSIRDDFANLTLELAYQALSEANGDADLARSGISKHVFEPVLERLWNQGDNGYVMVSNDAGEKQRFPSLMQELEADLDCRLRSIMAEVVGLGNISKAELAVRIYDDDHCRDLVDVVEAARASCFLEDAKRFLEVECQICYNPRPQTKILSTIYCQCAVCTDCLRHYYQVRIREHNLVQFVCPVCTLPNVTELAEKPEGLQDFLSNMDIQLRHIMSQEEHDIFLQKQRDFTLHRNPDFRWCPHCDNGFVNEIPDRLSVQCPTCHKRSCFRCKAKWEDQHEGKSCEKFQLWKMENDPEFQAMGLAAHMSQNGINCPNCKFRYELSCGGCMHFTCRNCKFQFCSGCDNRFMKADECPRPSHRTFGLHCHCPRDCLSRLRDNSIKELQNVLEKNDVEYKEQPTEAQLHQAQENAEDGEPAPIKCSIMEQKDGEALYDEECGKDTTPGHAGLCEKHYKEYLVHMINCHALDPAPFMTAHELINVVRQSDMLDECPKEDDLTDEQYRERLLQFVQARIPLTRTRTCTGVDDANDGDAAADDEDDDDMAVAELMEE